MTHTDTLSIIRLGMTASIPILYGFAALGVSRASPFRFATLVSMLTTGIALLVSALGLAAQVYPPLTGAATMSAMPSLLCLDLVTCAMLTLVCTLAVVIVRFSRTYLNGEPGVPRYCRALLGALSGVTLLVISNNLGIISLAWTATSFAVHQLLTFYHKRPQALIAAHKKFFLSRLADGFFFAAFALVWSVVGTLQIDVVNRWATAHGSLPLSLHVAAVLLVIGVSLKTAQLPFHGWLTQVMEAPTPVSALLHAGVVNIGGVVLIRVAPLLSHAHYAQLLLIAIGMTTAIAASLVMTTRVSIKVALAWSTIAQMGFMLLQCGLGAWHLALLHLFAHSLYKAHAFLSSGTAVGAWRGPSATAQPRPSLPIMLAAALTLLTVVATTLGAARTAGWTQIEPSLAPLAVVLALSIAPLLAHILTGGLRTIATSLAQTAFAVLLYFGGHSLFARALPLATAHHSSSVEWAIVGCGFSLLFAIQTLVQTRPNGALARWLQPRLFAGLYLDELFTRVTLRLWPPRVDSSDPATTAPTTNEVLPC